MTPRVFIAGSCVSRDTFGRIPAKAASIVGYVARQSLISTWKPPRSVTLDLSAIKSAFQRTVTQGAIRGDLIARLVQTRPDFLVLDIVDERAGVYELDDGTYLTRAIEVDYFGLQRQFEDRIVALHQFRSESHLDLYLEALASFRRVLDEKLPRTRLLVVAPEWATRFEDGSRTSTSYGLLPAEANLIQEVYFAAIREQLPVEAFIGRDLATVAAADHRWGPGCFHFRESEYAAMAAAIRARLLS